VVGFIVPFRVRCAFKCSATSRPVRNGSAMEDGDGTSALDVLERFQELENQVILH